MIHGTHLERRNIIMQFLLTTPRSPSLISLFALESSTVKMEKLKFNDRQTSGAYGMQSRTLYVNKSWNSFLFSLSS